MKTAAPSFDSRLITEYERIRAQILSAGVSSPLSRIDRCIISKGLFQWALHKQPVQEKTSVSLSQEPFTAKFCNAKGSEYPEIGVINLIASMTIRSITGNRESA
jgi:hypothetical protein